MNDHQQFAAERGRRAEDLRAAAIALLEQQTIAAGVMLDLDDDTCVAAGPKSAILHLLSKGAPAATSGDAPADPVLATWPERIWLQGGPDEREEYPGASEDLTWCSDNIYESDVEYLRADLARIERAAAPAPEVDPEKDFSDWMEKRGALGAGAVPERIFFAGHSAGRRAAVSAAAKPTADLSLHNRIAQRLAWLAEGRQIAIADLVADVQSLLATKPAAAPEVPEELRKALQTVARWELPPTGKTWDDGSPMSYAACYGSNGERDYMRQVALNALAAAPAAPTPAAPADWRDTVEALEEAYEHDSSLDWMDRAAKIIRGFVEGTTPATSTIGAAQTADQVRDQALEDAARHCESAELLFDVDELMQRTKKELTAITANMLAEGVRALKRPATTHNLEAGE